MERKQSDGPAASSTPKPSSEGSGDPVAPALGDFSTRTILALALPALGALVIEPTLILIDSAMVGYLGVAPLAGLSLASTILMTLVGVFVFLAYSTTALTSRAVGRGDRAGALHFGIQAVWLAAGLGAVITAVLIATAPTLAHWLGADPEVMPQAVAYLRGGAPGMIGMLMVLAATGALRGLLDMRTPLYVVAAGALVNVGLNFLLIFALNLQILGAGIALSITQTLMGLALTFALVRQARGRIPLRPSVGGLWGAIVEGAPLFIRTVSLRAALLATVSIAALGGTAMLAAHQVVNSLWNWSAFILDALAIAAQSLVGVAVGAGNPAATKALVRRLSLWGVGAGVVLGTGFALSAGWLPSLFGTDPTMHQVATRGLLVAAVFMPVGGLVFLLDGALIGAGQGRYLALMGVVTLAVYLPALALIHKWITGHAPLDGSQQMLAFTWLWLAFAGWFMSARAVANAARAFSPKLGTVTGRTGRRPRTN